MPYTMLVSSYILTQHHYNPWPSDTCISHTVGNTQSDSGWLSFLPVCYCSDFLLEPRLPGLNSSLEFGGIWISSSHSSFSDHSPHSIRQTPYSHPYCMKLRQQLTLCLFYILVGNRLCLITTSKFSVLYLNKNYFLLNDHRPNKNW